MPPQDYKAVWDALATTERDALLHVAGYTERERLDAAARHTVQVLEATVGVHPGDVFLEIGCGVGRVAHLLAPRVARWIGCDVAPNMLAHARQRLAGVPNVELVEISGTDLAPVPDASVDAVYCTVVFMHLEAWDRFGYLREAHRVLRPGGRVYCDNINLAHDEGWQAFEAARRIPPAERPPHLSRCSTEDEFRIFLARAGFRQARIETRHLWVQGCGVK